MKFRFIYTVFTLSILALLFMSNEDGRADSQGKGNTGAPGDEMVGNNPRTCVTCHNNNADVQMTQEIELLDGTGATVAEYMPGETYRVKVTNTVAVGSASGYGFQVVNLKAAEGDNGDATAAFSNPDANVKIAVATSNGRQYAEHNGLSETNTFEVDWTAPDQGTGVVTFYAAGNAVNDNGMSSGDAAATSTLELAEADPSSVIETTAGVKIFLFPNPVQEDMKVTLESDAAAEFNIEIFDMQGRLTISETLSFGAGESTFVYNVGELSRGTYLVKFSNNDKIATAKMLKL